MRSDLRGVYTSMPAELPATLQGRDAVVVGGAAETVLRLAGWCRSVTYLAPRTVRVAAPNVTVLHGTDVVCVDGIDRLESVVVRNLCSGAVSACNADALFLLQGEQS